ncbi:MAG: hypothetical protein FWH03_03745, partial [Firmicutes bacterium]|nr:hypothetical protein [Bacillota bacterium]
VLSWDLPSFFFVLKKVYTPPRLGQVIYIVFYILFIIFSFFFFLFYIFFFLSFHSMRKDRLFYPPRPLTRQWVVRSSLPALAKNTLCFCRL